MDDILGPNALLTGDVIAFRGPSGTLKTELAVAFALSLEPSSEFPNQQLCSLFVPLKDSVSAVQRLLDRRPSIIHRSRGEAGIRGDNQIRVLELPTGYIHPGVFFWHLEKELDAIEARGFVVDRLVFDNAEQWDINCPFISSDPSFASTLTGFARRYGIMTVFVSHASAESGSIGRVEESLLSSADVTLSFWRYSFGGKERAAFRVVESRSMEHSRDNYDLAMLDGRLEIGLRAKQLRFDHDGRISSVPIKLYLHSEGPIQDKYNDDIRASLRPVLSRDAEVDSKDRTYVLRWLDLNEFSTVDEVQILQLDEFQVPAVSRDEGKARGRDLALLKFPSAFEPDITELISELHGRLGDRAGVKLANHFQIHALPYYQNMGVLVINDFSSVGKCLTGASWLEIADACEAWELDQGQESATELPKLFFDFACDKNETYICLFLEMAIGSGIPKPSPTQSIGMWMEEYQDELAEVLRQYVLLTHRAHRIHPGRPMHERIAGAKNAEGMSRESASELLPVVWRQWFTTATDLFCLLHPELWSGLRVQMLPANACVAGEWYLAIPGYSAAPEFGAEIVRHLLTPEEEFERLRQGVGLPVRRAFYDPGRIGSDMLRCRYFGLPAEASGVALVNALRRSEIRSYLTVSRILSFHLKRVVEVRDIWKRSRMTDIESAIVALIRNLNDIANQ